MVCYVAQNNLLKPFGGNSGAIPSCVTTPSGFFNWSNAMSSDRDIKGCFIKGHKSGMSNKTHSTATKTKMSQTRRAIMPTLPYYKGGINKLLRRMYDTSYYRNWRKAVFERDNYICQECNSSGLVEAHHKTEFSKLFKTHKIQNYEDAVACTGLWDIGNGLTLCRDCHNLTKRGNPKFWRQNND